MIAYDRFQRVLDRLPAGVSLSTHRCGTCSRCRAQWGLTGIVDVALGRVEKATGGGWHYDILWENKERVLGGRVSRIIGLTDEAAFAAVEALLP